MLRVMTIALGIDTGGTYTDAVLLDMEKGEVLAVAKSLTTRQQLSLGIHRAISSAFEKGRKHLSARSVHLVALSTTLATNAIAEGHGVPVALFLIGYDRQLINKYHFRRDLVTSDVVYINGGHNTRGAEVRPLDENAARKAILDRKDRVEAFAVSGYFSALNPDHEQRVRDMMRSLTGLPVTCGHELSTRLDSIRRATTAALNARLVPMLQDLISDVRDTLKSLSIKAPLMVVKGDGSLVRAEWAIERPIETILSGPAASAIGARKLSGKTDVWAIDVGGTTTDIVRLKDGRPRVNAEGANIAGWRTMVKAVDVHTVGLGGDSHIHFDDDGGLRIGPSRVIPLCKLSHDYPQVIRELERQAEAGYDADEPAQFVTRWRKPRTPLDAKDAALLGYLEKEPRSIMWLSRLLAGDDPWFYKRLQSLESRFLIQRAGFTPTDALHCLKHFNRWDAMASHVAARILIGRQPMSPDDFCRRVIEAVSAKAAFSLISKAIDDDMGPPEWQHEPTARKLIAAAIEGREPLQFKCRIFLRNPLVAIGAPVSAYMPLTADRLKTALIIPPHAEAANAVGAVSGSVVQHIKVVVNPLYGGTAFRVHLPEGPSDFGDLEEAVAHARTVMGPRATAQAKTVGADQVGLDIDRHDSIASIKGNQTVFLKTVLRFTAYGRPAISG